jgi:hypothetical protein
MRNWLMGSLYPLPAEIGFSPFAGGAKLNVHSFPIHAIIRGYWYKFHFSLPQGLSNEAFGDIIASFLR